MSLIETVHLSHVPENLPVFIALYKDVTNAGFLREQLISGNEDFQYAFIDASTILSRKHIFAAVFRAINDHLNNRLKSHNVHSEIVVALGPSNNIADSLRRFGVADTTKDLLVVKLPVTSDITADSVTKHLEKYVEATPVPFNDETLSTMSDLAKIRKLYKLNQLASASPMDHVNAVKSLEPLILGSIAIRGAT